ncbi:MAG: hypothetical protein AAFS02_01660 [Pseudomonadota bacterium]
MHAQSEAQETPQQVYERLIAKQSLPGTLVGTVSGGLPAIALFFVFSAMGGVLAFFLVIPAFIIAYAAKFLGHPLEFAPRLIPGIAAALVNLSGALFLFSSPGAFALIPASLVIGVYFSKTTLTPLEEKAVWRYKNGFK